MVFKGELAQISSISSEEKIDFFNFFVYKGQDRTPNTFLMYQKKTLLAYEA